MTEPRTKSYVPRKIQHIVDLTKLDSCILGHIKASERQFRFVTPLNHFFSTRVVSPHLGATKRLHNSQKNAKAVKIATSDTNV